MLHLDVTSPLHTETPKATFSELENDKYIATVTIHPSDLS